MNTSAANLRQQRCANHPGREASARCPECGRFYCRECITEHGDRVLCASCLARVATRKIAGKMRWEWVPRVALVLLAVSVIYTVFFLTGSSLLSLPSHFHHKGGW